MNKVLRSKIVLNIQSKNFGISACFTRLARCYGCLFDKVKKKRHTSLIILATLSGCDKKKLHPTTDGGGMKDKGQIQL